MAVTKYQPGDLTLENIDRFFARLQESRAGLFTESRAQVARRVKHFRQIAEAAPEGTGGSGDASKKSYDLGWHHARRGKPEDPSGAADPEAYKAGYESARHASEVHKSLRKGRRTPDEAEASLGHASQVFWKHYGDIVKPSGKHHEIMQRGGVEDPHDLYHDWAFRSVTPKADFGGYDDEHERAQREKFGDPEAMHTTMEKDIANFVDMVDAGKIAPSKFATHLHTSAQQHLPAAWRYLTKSTPKSAEERARRREQSARRDAEAQGEPMPEPAYRTQVGGGNVGSSAGEDGDVDPTQSIADRETGPSGGERSAILDAAQDTIQQHHSDPRRSPEKWQPGQRSERELLHRVALSGMNPAEALRDMGLDARGASRQWASTVIKKFHQNLRSHPALQQYGESLEQIVASIYGLLLTESAAWLTEAVAHELFAAWLRKVAKG